TALAFLVIAADAMSGARPGARRASTTQFAQHIHAIETIALREPSVVRVDVMQGGREVWVIVAGRESGEIPDNERRYGETAPLPDDEIRPVASRIARAIEKELVYAGQIRVTVVRESRAVATTA
ncbi:MAG: hypothetical protein AAF658_09505, partial [Myxococcota bacterium]